MNSAVLMLSLAGLAPSAKLADRGSMTLEVAKQVAAAAEATAASNKWTMAIVTLMDDNQLGKAKRAAEFRRPTRVFDDQVVGGLKLPGTMPVEGGIPLMVDRKLAAGSGADSLAKILVAK